MHTSAEITRVTRVIVVVVASYHNRAAIHQRDIGRVKKRSYGTTSEVCCACEGGAECNIGI